MEQLKNKYANHKIEVWFQDESRFGQQGSLTHIWASRGSRPCCDKQTSYKWLYLFGAVCPETGNAVGYLMPTADTFCMNLHLAEISKQIADGVHVALLLDQAGWHRSKGLKVPDNITLVPLPAYSPELNPVELTWLYLKSHYLSNRVYPDVDSLYTAASEAWVAFISNPELVRSICNVSWIYSEILN